jgi:hypothetical protein
MASTRAGSADASVWVILCPRNATSVWQKPAFRRINCETSLGKIMSDNVHVC